MEWTIIGVLFSAGIFLIGFLTLLLVGVNTLLNAKIDPLKENQALFKENQALFNKRLEKLEKGQARLESLIKELLKDRK